MLFGPVEEVYKSAYNEITGEMIREAAIRTKGSGSPSNVDGNGFQRILANKSFKKSDTSLCDALVTLTVRNTLISRLILSSRRVIPMDKGNGEVQPIAVGEVIRRIIVKCVTKVTKQDTLESSGSLQLCPGHKSRSEKAVHAINAQLILARGDQCSVDSGCVKRLQLTKLSKTLHNIRVLCPAINTY